MRIAKFYCRDCKRFLTRGMVTKEVDENEVPHYLCLACKQRTVKVNKVRGAIVKDFIKYLEERGEVENYE